MGSSLRRTVFAVAFAAALGFGATQAFARNIECWDPELYTCSSHAHCAWICNELGNPNGGICRNSCCYCLAG